MASASPLHSGGTAPSYQQLSHDDERTRRQTSIKKIRVTSVWSGTSTAPLVSSIQRSSYEDEHTNPPPPTELPEQAPLTQEWGSVFDTQSKAYLWFCCVVMLVGWVFNNVLWMYVSMYFGGIYAFFGDQATALLYLIMQAPVVVYRLWWSRSITPEMRSTVDWKVYMWMGLLDALYNLLTSSSSPFVNGPVQNLLFQLPIPIVMVTLKLLWPGSTSYLLGQYVGSFIIIVGAVLSVLPQLIHPVEAIGLADNRWTALLTYTGGVIFYSFGTIYKAHALKHAPLIDYWYVSFVENAWNFVLGFLFLPLLWIPGMSQAESPTASWPNFQGGYTCFFHGYSPMDPNATCGQLWWISILWIASNIWVNVLGLVVCRLGDSVIFNVVNSVQLPLTNLCLASSFLMTTALVSPFSPMMGFAVGCTFVGFGIYSFLPMQKGPEEGKGEEKEADASEEGRKATSAKGGGGGRGGTKSIQHGEGANRLTSPLISEY